MEYTGSGGLFCGLVCELILTPGSILGSGPGGGGELQISQSPP